MQEEIDWSISYSVSACYIKSSVYLAGYLYIYLSIKINIMIEIHYYCQKYNKRFILFLQNINLFVTQDSCNIFCVYHVFYFLVFSYWIFFFSSKTNKHTTCNSIWRGENIKTLSFLSLKYSLLRFYPPSLLFGKFSNSSLWRYSYNNFVIIFDVNLAQATS